MNKIQNLREKIRLIVQVCFTAVTNGYVNGFATGTIFRGTTKRLCVPGLSCYSCPGALGACPIGALQAVLNSRQYKFSFYVIGLLMAAGAVIGRFVCGFLCPFGLFQDLLYRIPLFKKVKTPPGDRYLRWLKYVILAVFVIILPLAIVNIAGGGTPWFCKLICPSGTLMGGIPLVITNPGIRSAIGWLFTWKMFLLVAIVVWSMKVYRPFCRYLCPLGAIYGWFNPIALYRFKIEEEKCTGCKACNRACPMAIDVKKNPNSVECIRCGRCLSSCHFDALHSTFQLRSKKEAGEAVPAGEKRGSTI